MRIKVKTDTNEYYVYSCPSKIIENQESLEWNNKVHISVDFFRKTITDKKLLHSLRDII